MLSLSDFLLRNQDACWHLRCAFFRKPMMTQGKYSFTSLRITAWWMTVFLMSYIKRVKWISGCFPPCRLKICCYRHCNTTIVSITIWMKRSFLSRLRSIWICYGRIMSFLTVWLSMNLFWSFRFLGKRNDFGVYLWRLGMWIRKPVFTILTRQPLRHCQKTI